MPSVTQFPINRLQPAYSRLMFVLAENQNAIAAAFYYRYVVKCEIREFFPDDGLVDQEEHEITFKIAPNKEKRGVVDLSNVVKDYVTTDIQSHTNNYAIHNTQNIVSNLRTVIRVKLYIGSEYTSSALGTVTSSIPSYAAYEYLIFNGCQQDKDGLEFNLDKYLLTAGVSTGENNFLTCFDHTVERKVRLTDYGTVAFVNGILGHYDGSASVTNIGGIFVKFYDSSGTIITGDGGAGTTLDIENTANQAVNSQNACIRFAGVAPKNLTDAGYTIPANTDYYEVYAYQENIGGNPANSQTYKYKIVGEDCKGHETIRLAFLNRVGAYDYYNFNKRSTRVTNIDSEMFMKNTGSWQKDAFSYETYEHKNTTLNVQAVETIECNTEYITELEAEGLEELFTSPRVLMYDDEAKWQPVNITEKSYTKQRNVSDKLIQYIVSVEKSVAKRIQTN